MRRARSPVLRLLRLLPLICCVCAAGGYPFKTPLDLDVTPRVTVLSSGEHERTRAHTRLSLSQTWPKNKALELCT